MVSIFNVPFKSLQKDTNEDDIDDTTEVSQRDSGIEHSLELTDVTVDIRSSQTFSNISFIKDEGQSVSPD